MLVLEALVERAKNYDDPYGYKPEAIDWVLRIDKDGNFLGLIKEPAVLLLPQFEVKRTGTRPVPNIVDNFLYTLGSGRPGQVTENAWVRYEAFFELMTQLPDRFGLPIRRFLNHPRRPVFLPVGGKGPLTDEELRRVETAIPCEGEKVVPLRKGRSLTSDHEVLGMYALALVGARVCHASADTAPVFTFEGSFGEKVRFEIVGQPKAWWLDTEVQKLHASKLKDKQRKGGEGARGQCSICLEENSILARLIGGSSRFGGTLSSFNRDVYDHYGRKQAVNASVCEECATAIQVGLTSLDGKATSKKLSTSRYVVWWFEDPNTPTWETFDAIFSEKEFTLRPALAERAALAFESAGAGYLAIFEKVVDGRLACRRFARVRGAEIAVRLRWWIEACEGRSPYALAIDLNDGVRPSEGSMPFDAIQEMLYLNLLGGEPVSPALIAHVGTKLLRAHEKGYTDSHPKKERWGWQQFYNYTTNTKKQERRMTEEELAKRLDDLTSFNSAKQRASFYLGQAFARAEWLQITTRRNPQRTIGARIPSCLSALNGIDAVVRVIEKHWLAGWDAQRSQRSAGRGGDKTCGELLEKAQGCKYEGRLDRAAFLSGYSLFFDYEKARAKARAEKRKAESNKSESNDNTNTEN